MNDKDRMSGSEELVVELMAMEPLTWYSLLVDELTFPLVRFYIQKYGFNLYLIVFYYKHDGVVGHINILNLINRIKDNKCRYKIFKWYSFNQLNISKFCEKASTQTFYMWLSLRTYARMKE